MEWYFDSNTAEEENLYKWVRYKQDFNGLTEADKEYLVKELKRRTHQLLFP